VAACVAAYAIGILLASFSVARREGAAALGAPAVFFSIHAALGWGMLREFFAGAAMVPIAGVPSMRLKEAQSEARQGAVHE
jgi:hypothetical protein